MSTPDRADSGGPAFPHRFVGDGDDREGMSLRDYFASKAMTKIALEIGGKVQLQSREEIIKDIREYLESLD